MADPAPSPAPPASPPIPGVGADGPPRPPGGNGSSVALIIGLLVVAGVVGYIIWKSRQVEASPVVVE